MTKNLDVDPYNLFWFIWEFAVANKLNDILDNYCDDSDQDFDLFRNELRDKDDNEMEEMCNQIIDDLPRDMLVLLIKELYNLV
jgi:hypothetical protein